MEAELVAGCLEARILAFPRSRSGLEMRSVGSDLVADASLAWLGPLCRLDHRGPSGGAPLARHAPPREAALMGSAALLWPDQETDPFAALFDGAAHAPDRGPLALDAADRVGGLAARAIPAARPVPLRRSTRGVLGMGLVDRGRLSTAAVHRHLAARWCEVHVGGARCRCARSPRQAEVCALRPRDAGAG
jgi:hypothetical protein